MKPFPTTSALHSRRTRFLTLATLAALGGTAAQAQMPGPQPLALVTELRLQEFFKLPVGSEGLEISPALRQADGTTVALTGYMVQQEVPAAGEFLLTPRPVQMSEHADGDADDLPPATVRVRLAPTQRGWVVPHVQGLIRIAGLLSVGREEGTHGRVTWVQLQLPADALRGMQPPPGTAELHALHRH